MPYDDGKREKWKAAGYRTNLGSAAATEPPPAEFLRLYYLTSTQHALSNIALRRIKVARFGDANDPFELCALNALHLGRWIATRALQLADNPSMGMLCFSADWTSPMLWSHYADRHRGICLGFDVPRNAAEQVSYEAERLMDDVDSSGSPLSLSPELRRRLRTTKYSEWRYEEEWRVFVPLGEAEKAGGIYFRRLDAGLVLTEVILGARCEERVDDVRKLITSVGCKATTFGARLASGSFRIVPHEATIP